jgi:hypothetical protein
MRAPLLFCGIRTVLLASLVLTGANLAGSPAGEMAQAGKNFFAALTPEQKSKAIFGFKDDERQDWHFIPKPRKGLPLKEMTAPQRALAQALLASGLSQRGFAKAETIMSLEQILYDLESKSPTRDGELYFVTIFGQPGADAWGWRVEGHHLSLNFVVENEKVLAMSPAFFGANPAEILSGPRKGLRTLAVEEDIARALVKSLDAEQRKAAVIATDAPRDIITGASRKVKALEPAGIAAAQMNAAQKQQLNELLKEYAFRYRTETAEEVLKKIQNAGEEKLHFAWAGGLEPGEGHYYRIQSPDFIIEYDNTQDHANHIHSVWRDIANDFGEDLLRAHYDQVPHEK